jgi:hypothetical protein
MISTKFIAVGATGISMLGTVAAVDHLAVRPNTDLTEVTECVSSQFAQNSFDISSASNSRFEGRVTGGQPGGPTIAIVFNADHSGTVMFDESAMSLRAAQYRLGPIEKLATNINQHCLRLSDRKLSQATLD